jgi:hypothetical protein
MLLKNMKEWLKHTAHGNYCKISFSSTSTAPLHF